MPLDVLRHLARILPDATEATPASLRRQDKTKPAWREAGSELGCLVAGDGFEPTTFGL